MTERVIYQMMKNKIPVDKVFVIAEIANSHTGSPKKLNELVEKTIEIKPDAIKFQLFKTDELLVNNHPENRLYKQLEIPDPEWIKIFKKLKRAGIRIFVDVFSVNRAKFANKVGTDAFKIHSSDINNIELLEYVARTKKPVLLSCSGCKINEIDNAVNIIKKTSDSQVILMHGFQGFPTNISQINLKRITSLRQRYHLPVGYMDHIDGDSESAMYLPLIALGLGANIIEKHITMNRKLKEEDYQSALNPHEFLKMVNLLRSSYPAMGDDSFDIVDKEKIYRKNMKKRLVARHNLKAKTTIRKSDIVLKRIHNEIPEINQEFIIGCNTKKLLERDEPFTEKNTELKQVKTVAALACRVQSQRLFCKPLQLIDGKRTILDQIIWDLKQCNLVDEIVLAISENPGNEIFVEFALKNNLKFVRGDDDDVLQRIIRAAEHVDANTVLRITSEDPFKHWEVIDSAIEQHIKSKADFTYTQDLPDGAGFEIIKLESLKRSHEKGKKRHRSELVTSYIHDHKKEFKIRPFLVKPKLRRPEIRLTVDYPEDLILTREIISKLPKKNYLFHLDDIIGLLDENPALMKINSKFVDHPNRIWL